MPVFEVVCRNVECLSKDVVRDTFLRSWRSPNPSCPACQCLMDRVMLTPPKSIWLGTVGRFSDPSREYYDESGFAAWRVNSSRNPDGSPEAVRITTRQEQVEFARAEGLRLPDDMNSNAEISKDGKHISTCGVRGQWTGVPSRMVGTTEGHEEGWV